MIEIILRFIEVIVIGYILVDMIRINKTGKSIIFPKLERFLGFDRKSSDKK